MNQEILGILVGAVITGAAWFIRVMFFNPTARNTESVEKIQFEILNMSARVKQLEDKMMSLDMDVRQSREEHKQLHIEVSQLAVDVSAIKAGMEYMNRGIDQLLRKQQNSDGN